MSVVLSGAEKETYRARNVLEMFIAKHLRARTWRHTRRGRCRSPDTPTRWRRRHRRRLRRQRCRRRRRRYRHRQRLHRLWRRRPQRRRQWRRQISRREKRRRRPAAAAAAGCYRPPPAGSRRAFPPPRHTSSASRRRASLPRPRARGRVCIRICVAAYSGVGRRRPWVGADDGHAGGSGCGSGGGGAAGVTAGAGACKSVGGAATPPLRAQRLPTTLPPPPAPPQRSKLGHPRRFFYFPHSGDATLVFRRLLSCPLSPAAAIRPAGLYHSPSAVTRQSRAFGSPPPRPLRCSRPLLNSAPQPTSSIPSGGDRE